MRTAPNGWRWMRIGLNQHSPAFSMNEKGVVMTTNDGDKTDVHHPHDKVRAEARSGSMIRQVITTCATAAEGVEIIKNIGRNGIAAGSNGIYFIADPNRAFMINLAFGYAEVKELTGGMVVITNAWHLPGGEEISTKTLPSIRGDRAREANTRASLQESRVDGKYNIRGCIDTSRKSCGKLYKEKFPFRYNSDCRGSGIFLPVVGGQTLKTPQMPLNMPTYDEMLGKNGVTNENYNERLLATVQEDSYNMLTIHAEAEGGACMKMFDEFLTMAKARGITFTAPGDLLPADTASLPRASIVKGEIPGREGWLALKG